MADASNGYARGGGRAVVSVMIDEATKKALDELPSGLVLCEDRFTPQMDEILLTYWNVKRKDDVARIIGIPVTTCRKRYRQLTAV